MPVERDAEEYNMTHKRRGKAVIFNHDTFSSVPSRAGSQLDVQNLEISYKALGFEVTTYSNLSHTEITKVVHSCKYLKNYREVTFTEGSVTGHNLI
jgi:caspase-like apoptosis-related cysteine protease